MGLEATYDVSGPPGAPALVFLHGTRLSRTSWAPQVADLSSEHRCITLDLPGHGALRDTPFTLEAASRHVAEVIDEAADGRAILVGLSLGGYVAMDVAARSPERVAGLVLAGATREPIGAWTLPYRWLAFVFGRAHRGALRRFDTWFFRLRFPATVADQLINGGFYPAGGAVALGALMGERFLPRLTAYPGPTLIVNGALDFVFRLGERAFLAAARDGRRVVIPRATHLVNLDRPRPFNDALRRFARRVRELHGETPRPG